MILSDTRPGGETNAIDTLPTCILHNMMGHTSPGVKYSFVTAFAKVGVKFVKKNSTVTDELTTLHRQCTGQVASMPRERLPSRHPHDGRECGKSP